MNKSIITKELFEETFRPDITVLLDWDKLKKNYTLELKSFTKKNEISHFYTPWHLDYNNNEIDCFEAPKKPLNLHQVSEKIFLLNKNRQQSIIKLTDSFNKSQKRIIVNIPLFKLSENNFFILDGNHRMSALLRSNADFTIFAYIVVAPIKADILQDLQNII